MHYAHVHQRGSFHAAPSFDLPMSSQPSTPSSWQALSAHRHALAGRSLQSLFEADHERFAQLSLAWDSWLVDFSKQRVTAETIALLVAQARERNLPAWIGALLAGEKVNLSEARPALHTALRQQNDSPLLVDGVDIVRAIRSTQARMRALTVQIRGGARLGATGRPLRHVVNLGIGGSDLGPRLVCDALGGPRSPKAAGIDVSFVSNIDPESLTRALSSLDPATTMFIVTSKTFTTAETLANAQSARDWLARSLGGGIALSPHFVAVTGNADAARAFGVAGGDILPIWDWVGGRYSVWSAAGLPIAIRCGWDAFVELLAGAASLDAHFRDAPLERNLPVLLALVDLWNSRALDCTQRIVVPYAHALALLPGYLQQLVLESNGKSVARDGSRLQTGATAALWGGTGTDCQHAFFQWLHQGTQTVPVEFIVPLRTAHPLGEQQSTLVANALAQAQALMIGRPGSAGDGAEPDALAAQRACRGDHPSTMLLLPELNARRLGQLLALYEHRTFVEGIMLGINSFDQWGVELGKMLAGPLVAALRDGADVPGADASTRGLAAHARMILQRRN
jgi:glucose-6-phosphate isomerase